MRTSYADRSRSSCRSRFSSSNSLSTSMRSCGSMARNEGRLQARSGSSTFLSSSRCQLVCVSILAFNFLHSPCSTLQTRIAQRPWSANTLISKWSLTALPNYTKLTKTREHCSSQTQSKRQNYSMKSSNALKRTRWQVSSTPIRPI